MEKVNANKNVNFDRRTLAALISSISPKILNVQLNVYEAPFTIFAAFISHSAKINIVNHTKK